MNLISVAAGNGSFGSIQNDGVLATEIGLGGVNGIGFDTQGNLFFADRNLIKVDRFTGLAYRLDSAEENYDIEGITFDENGNLYVAESVNHKVRKISPDFFLDDPQADDGDGINQSVTAIDLPVGTYEITELVPEGWELNNVDCQGGADLGTLSADTLSIEVGGGEDVVCTFHNSLENQLGSATITIVEATTPFNSKVDFRFGGDLGVFRLDDAGGDDGDSYSDRKVFTVDAGTYKVNQQEFSQWNLRYISCSNGVVPETDLDKQELIVTLAADDDLICIFLNERAGFINVRKVNDLNGDSRFNSGEPFLAGWTIQVYGSNNELVDSKVTDADGRVSFKVEAGNGGYTVCEVDQPGWSVTRPVSINPAFNQACYSVSVSPRQVAWMRFFNTQTAVARSAFTAQDDDVLYTWLPISDDIEFDPQEEFVNPYEVSNPRELSIYLPFISQ